MILLGPYECLFDVIPALVDNENRIIDNKSWSQLFPLQRSEFADIKRTDFSFACELPRGNWWANVGSRMLH